MRISDWSSDVCSSDLAHRPPARSRRPPPASIRASSEPPHRDPQHHRRGREIEPVIGLVAVPDALEHPVPLRVVMPLLGADHHRVIVRGGGAEAQPDEIGRASCRERVWQYGEISVVAVSLKKKKKYRMQ